MIESSTQNSNTVHREKVNSLSRICGERVKRQVKLMSIKLCSNYAKELSIFHAIYVGEDKDGQRSTGMCRKCYLRLISCKHASISTHHYQTTSSHAAADIERTKNISTAFDGTLPACWCAACTHFDLQCTGGRPKKAQVSAQKIKISMDPDITPTTG